MAGVLDRALRDLYSKNYIEYASAYEWFKSTEEDSSDLYTFQNCIDYLELSIFQIRFLHECADQSFYKRQLKKCTSSE